MAAIEEGVHVSDLLQCFREIAATFKLTEPNGTEQWCDDHGTWRQLVATHSQWVLGVHRPDTESICSDGYCLQHNNDFVVGFLARSAGRLTVSIGPGEACAFDMLPGQFKFAYDDAFVIPTMCMRFHEVRLTFTGEEYPDVVHCSLGSNECRRAMCTMGTSCPMPSDPTRSVSFAQGMFREDHVVPGSIRLPYMRGPMLMANFLTPAEVELLASEARPFAGMPTSLHPVPAGVKAVVQEAATRWFSQLRPRLESPERIVMVRRFRETLTVVGDQWTVGDGDGGMHVHRDASYQGGQWTVLLYLADVVRGGETVFGDIDGTTIAPRSGTAVVFGVEDVHHARPVEEGHKVFVAFEANTAM